MFLHGCIKNEINEFNFNCYGNENRVILFIYIIKDVPITDQFP